MKSSYGSDTKMVIFATESRNITPEILIACAALLNASQVRHGNAQEIEVFNTVEDFTTDTKLHRSVTGPSGFRLTLGRHVSISTESFKEEHLTALRASVDGLMRRMRGGVAFLEFRERVLSKTGMGETQIRAAWEAAQYLGSAPVADDREGASLADEIDIVRDGLRDMRGADDCSGWTDVVDDAIDSLERIHELAKRRGGAEVEEFRALVLETLKRVETEGWRDVTAKTGLALLESIIRQLGMDGQ